MVPVAFTNELYGEEEAKRARGSMPASSTYD